MNSLKDMTVFDAANTALNYDTPEEYNKYFEYTMNIFKILFKDYYQKFVLDMPTLEERWDRYAHTPIEWLEHDDWIIRGIEVIVPINGVNYKLDFGHIMCADQDRGREFDLETIVTYIDELVERINDGEELTEYAEYVYPHGSIEIPLTLEIINQWKEQLINKKIGSFRNDW